MITLEGIETDLRKLADRVIEDVKIQSNVIKMIKLIDDRADLISKRLDLAFKEIDKQKDEIKKILDIIE